MADIAANFTTNRMLTDYEERFTMLYDRNQQMVAHDYTQAREIAAWKRRVGSRWDKVHVISVKRLDMGKRPS